MVRPSYGMIRLADDGSHFAMGRLIALPTF